MDTVNVVVQGCSPPPPVQELEKSKQNPHAGGSKTPENLFFAQAAIRLQHSFLLGTLDARALDKSALGAIKYRLNHNSWKLG